MQNQNDISHEDIARNVQLSPQSGKRAVVQLNDNNEILKIYERMTKASEVVGVSSRSIRDAAKGNSVMRLDLNGNMLMNTLRIMNCRILKS